MPSCQGTKTELPQPEWVKSFTYQLSPSANELQETSAEFIETLIKPSTQTEINWKEREGKKHSWHLFFKGKSTDYCNRRKHSLGFILLIYSCQLSNWWRGIKLEVAGGVAVCTPILFFSFFLISEMSVANNRLLVVIIASFNIAKIPKNGKLSFHPVSPHHGLFKIFNQGNGKASWSFILISWEDYYIHAGLLLDSSAQYIPLNHFTSNIASSCVAFCKRTDWKVGREHASGVTNHVEDLYITLSLPDTSPFKWERNGRHKLQPEDAQSIGPPTDWRAICHSKPSCFSVPAKDVAVSCISYCSIPPYPRSDTKVQLMFRNNDINIALLCWLDQCQFVEMPYQSP